MKNTFNSSFSLPGEISLSFSSAGLDDISKVQDIARAAITKAFNSARKTSLGEIQSYLIRKVMEHPDVRSLAPGTELIAALGIANASSVQSSLEASLQRHMLGPQSSKGIGKGATSPTKGSSNRLPSITLGMTQDGKNALVNESFGSYTSRSSKSGKTSEIPWLNWMLNKESGRVFGYSVNLGDHPKSRTGEAEMRQWGSFSINSWTQGSSDFLSETLGRASIRDKVLSIFRKHLDLAMESAIQRANRESKGSASSGREVSATDLGAEYDIEQAAVATGGFEEAEEMIDAYATAVYNETGKKLSQAFIDTLESVGRSGLGLSGVVEQITGDARSRLGIG
jgi:hypothetical protein